MNRLFAAALFGGVLSACGTEQSPSFTENRETRMVRMTVRNDPASAGKSAAPRESMEAVNIDAVLDASLGEETPTGDTTPASTDIASGETPSAASDGSPGSSSAGGDASDGPTSGGAVAAGDEVLGSVPQTTGSSGNADAVPTGSATGGSETLGGMPSSGGGTPDEGGANAPVLAEASPSPMPSPEPSSTPSTPGSIPQSSSGNAGDNGIESPTNAELSACAKLQGVSASRIKIAGNQNDIQLTSSTIAAIKITGNQNYLALSLAGLEGAKLAGLCVFLAGNQARLDAKIGLTVERLVYIGRGNESRGSFAVRPGGAFGAMVVDLSGNGSSLRIEGAGAACGAAHVRQRGNGTQFNCN